MLPKPKSDDISSCLNALTDGGRVIENKADLHSLLQDIRNLERSSPIDFHLFMAAYYSLTGDYKQMQQYGDMALVKFSNDHTRLIYQILLTNCGFFSRAREISQRIDTRVPEFVKEKLIAFQNSVLLRQALIFADTLKRTGEDTSMMTKRLQKVSDLLSKYSIQESAITRMLDIAGNMLRENKLLSPYSPVIFADDFDDLVYYRIPLKVSIEEAIDLDWELNIKLFEKYPDAPASVVSLGFISMEDPTYTYEYA